MSFTDNKKYQEAVQFRDWQTCDLICEEHRELVSEIEKRDRLISLWIKNNQNLLSINEYDQMITDSKEVLGEV